MSRCPGPHLLSCGLCGGTDAGLRARAEAAEWERDRLRGALERAERRLTELADVETFDAEVPWPENEKPEERARAGAEDARAALAGEGEVHQTAEGGKCRTTCRTVTHRVNDDWCIECRREMERRAETEALPICASGRRVSECDGSRAACPTPEKAREP